jgi:hypothetical protein
MGVVRRVRNPPRLASESHNALRETPKLSQYVRLW